MVSTLSAQRINYKVGEEMKLNFGSYSFLCPKFL